MKSINEQAKNTVNLVGKVVDATFRSGNTKLNQPYESCTLTIRVTQEYHGREETSDIQVSDFVTKFTKQNKPNPFYESFQSLKDLKTIQTHGEGEADTVSVGRMCSISENNFVSRNGQLIHGWSLNTRTITRAKAQEVGTFDLDIFIFDMHDEMNHEGEPTGRFIVKGGLVQYGGSIDVLEFVWEEPDEINYVQRNWNINDTVNIRGRIRVTSEETKATHSGGWGEDIPETTTRMVRELVACTGSEGAFEEDFAYDPADIKRAMNERKARLEQLQVDAQQKAKSVPKAEAATTAAPSSKRYDWE